MRWVVARVPCGLGSLLLGAVACGFAGALIARHALVGFGADQQVLTEVGLVGLAVVGLAGLGQGLRRLRIGTFERRG